MTWRVITPLLATLAMFFVWMYIFKPFHPAADLWPTSLSVHVDPREIAFGPDQRTDNPFNTFGEESKIVAYLAHGDSYVFTGDTLAALRASPNPVLTHGMAGAFDDCGAWINSAQRDGMLVRAWYHAETDCSMSTTRKSVAYAESGDGGRTFTKPDYPNNQVITAPPRFRNAREAGEGDHRVIRVGEYFYMYFVASRDFQVRVARSRIADGGRPGTWFKYDNGAFSEPGIGGESSPIAVGILARSWVSFDSSLDVFIGISQLDRGFGLAVSRDGLTGWQKATGIVLAGDSVQANRDVAPTERVDYPSLIALDGDPDNISGDFWIYYLLVKPGDSLQNKRYLARQRVHIARSPLSNAAKIMHARGDIA